MCTTAHSVEVLRLKCVKDRHFYSMGGLTGTRISVTLSTKLSMLARLEVACPRGPMRPWYNMG